MTAPGRLLATAAPIGSNPPAGRFAITTRGAGAVVGNHRTQRPMKCDEAPKLSLKFEEAELVAADLARVWTGMTGLTEVPKLEQIADVVQRTLRKSREIIASRGDPADEARMEIAESEVPY